MNDIVSGTVTHRRDHVPARKIVKRVAWIVAAIFVAFLAFGLTLNAMSGQLTSHAAPLVTCDAGTQRHCYNDFADSVRG